MLTRDEELTGDCGIESYRELLWDELRWCCADHAVCCEEEEIWWEGRLMLGNVTD
jgi:hypothetical protein